MSVFISYSRKDSSSAGLIAEALRDAGISVWIDTANLMLGKNWIDAITRAIQEADLLLLLFSSNSAVSRSVEQEIRYALTYGIPALVVRLDDSPISHDLLDVQSINLYDNFNEDLKRLVELVVGQLSRQTTTKFPKITLKTSIRDVDVDKFVDLVTKLAHQGASEIEVVNTDAK